jgi:hypothetical protein
LDNGAVVVVYSIEEQKVEEVLTRRGQAECAIAREHPVKAIR